MGGVVAVILLVLTGYGLVYLSQKYGNDDNDYFGW